ncbi:response regulator transcription factor [Actinacidiphila reveromycinica]|uniref:response regulator transcription factor n=1 Tax=Actinacidiphila reveromycinica TaxID=659352 RepID=UPI001F2076B6|nr:response regulator transcription factor [Streptomyces sp. SN-593]
MVEQHTLIRRGLASLLSAGPHTCLLSAVAEPHELSDVLAGLPPLGRASAVAGPDVIVLGMSAGFGASQGETVELVCGLGAVLVVADFADGGEVTMALRSGAHGCVSRMAEESELLNAVGVVGRGGIYIDPLLAEHFHNALRLPPGAVSPTLARREVETLRWLATGLTHRQIGRRMDLTEATVSTYVKRIRNKLGVGNKAELTRKAFELGLLSASDVRHSPVESHASADREVRTSVA